MKAIVFQATRRQAFRRGRVTRTAKGAGCAKADIIEQEIKTFGAPLGGRNGVIGGNFVSGSFAS